MRQINESWILDNNITYELIMYSMCCVLKVILQLCRHVRFVEQLVETDELHCVIIALTSLWDQCSSSWRRQASRVLRAVSAAQVPNTVPTLQGQPSFPNNQIPTHKYTNTLGHKLYESQACRLSLYFIVGSEFVPTELFEHPHIFTCPVFGH